VLTVCAHPLDFLLPELIYSSSQLVLYRFFALHFLLSLIILFLILVHLYLLHTYTSSNTFLNLSSSLFISFYLFVFKDVYYYGVFYLSICCFIFFYNFEFLSNPVNLIPASSLSTPLHILPESYFLIYYSLLRALPSKLFGIIIVIVYMFYLVVPFTSLSSLSCFSPYFIFCYRTTQLHFDCFLFSWFLFLFLFCRIFLCFLFYFPICRSSLSFSMFVSAVPVLYFGGSSYFNPSALSCFFCRLAHFYYVYVVYFIVCYFGVLFVFLATSGIL